MVEKSLKWQITSNQTVSCKKTKEQYLQETDNPNRTRCLISLIVFKRCFVADEILGASVMIKRFLIG